MNAIWREGLLVTPTEPPGMAVAVQPGAIEANGRRIDIAGVERLPLAPPPVLQLRGHYYALEREGEKSPCGWDGSGRRGSNFKPYQMRVPGTLRVTSVDGLTTYAADADYVQDDYWGSVKAKPGGRLKVGDTVLLDYDAYTCRYHTIYVDEVGRIGVAAGSWRYGDETNLLLPEPPPAPAGSVALASVFVPWGAEAVYARSCHAVYEGGEGRLDWESRHLDYRPRVYEIDATGADIRVSTLRCAYGEEPGRALAAALEESGELDLPVAKADGTPVYWGVRMPWREWTAAYPLARRVTVRTYPANIMDLRGGAQAADNVLSRVKFEENGVALADWRAGLLAKPELHVCFLGESTTYGGDWTLLIVQRLQQLLPGVAVHWSNPSDGGHSSVRGFASVQRTKSFGHEYDIVFVEYLINDTGCEDEAIHAAMTGIVEWTRGRNPHALVVLLAGNGGNPMFIPRYNPAQFERVYRIHRAVAREQGALFVGMYDYFRELDRLGTYFLTVLKENMINHPYSSTAIDGTPWDRLTAEAFVRWLTGKLTGGNSATLR
ncbi:SGNH/GDSL hydrolase family protein [Paenibacillus cymbidii]|uniref:SGNH/GDSL hydrolase family protein n=1 Tax=Paenibacillus cymbidii TaxID=1639034 RepID=UPI001080D489|nr:SGNH/GDSL hydrolase family protein [Paenibacillus cymbidii]